MYAVNIWWFAHWFGGCFGYFVVVIIGVIVFRWFVAAWFRSVLEVFVCVRGCLFSCFLLFMI